MSAYVITLAILAVLTAWASAAIFVGVVPHTGNQNSWSRENVTATALAVLAAGLLLMAVGVYLRQVEAMAWGGYW